MEQITTVVFNTYKTELKNNAVFLIQKSGCVQTVFFFSILNTIL